MSYEERTGLKYLAAGGLTVAVGGSYRWLSKERVHADLSLDLLMKRLNSLELDNVETIGSWELARTFHHLAQSVEFSMTGSPL